MEDGNTVPTFTISDDNDVVGDLVDEDVEDQVVHDQLPSVEEAKANLAHKPAGGISSLKWTICAGFAFVILIVGVTLLAVLVPKENSGSSSSSSPTPEESRQDNVITLLLVNEITPESTLRDPSTPQARAAQFIANGDTYQMAIDAETVQGFIERYVLAIIYFHFNGETAWTYQNDFMTPQDHCNWFQKFTTTGGSIIREGVLCNEEGHVTTLSLCKLSMVSSFFNSAALFQSVSHSYIIFFPLAYNGLKGDGFPDEIRWFQKLDTFHVYFNEDITGEFPRALQFMPNLKSVALHYNSLTGVIPEWIGDLTGLTTLLLGDNLFEGEVPISISNLRILKFLALDDNLGLTGDVHLFTSMSELQTLYVEGNMFDGNMDTSFFLALPKLMEFDISDNMMEGDIPLALFDHEVLMIVDMSDNKFSGELPDDISQNTNLQYLALHNNLLSGIIPDRIRHLEQMMHLDLSFNQFSGAVADNLGTLTELRYLQTSGNNFTSKIMQDIDFSQLTNLQELAMKDNNLKGKIADWIGEFTNLQLLDLDANQLTGEIPFWIGNLLGLDHLLLNRNKLTGALPVEMGSLKDLDVLLLDGNSFTGNADIVCSNVTPKYFISDCNATIGEESPLFECECCTTCCEVGDADCNNIAWTSNVDPKWEYGWVRSRYIFSGANAPAEYAKDGDVESIPGDPAV
jgi:Leucine-rich repeat (LRR) protein